MNRRIELRVRDSECTLCKLHETADVVCETGSGASRARIMVVSKLPNSKAYQELIETELEQAGVQLDQVYFTAALKCRTFEVDASAKDVKACRTYLEQEMALVRPEWILALGNEALQATTGHSGITKWRGRICDGLGCKVVATLAPAMINRNPGYKQSWAADLQYFAHLVYGRKAKLEPLKHFSTIDTREKLQRLCGALDRAELMSYDVETTISAETDESARMVSLAGTLVIPLEGSKKLLTWALPLYHPESPWRRSWRSVLRHLAPHFERVPKSVAHNGKFDARWLRAHGVHARVTFDTIIAAHLLDENRVKGLKPLCRIFFGVPPWDLNTKELLSTPLDQVLLYNALDTYYDYHLYLELRRQLMVQPRLLRLFKLLLMPANEELIEMERRGIWADPEKLATASKIVYDMRAEIDAELMKWVPDPEDSTWPTNAKDKPCPVNFNASTFCRWFLFEHLGLPVLESGKVGPSMKEAVLLELKETPGHPVVDLLLDRAKWQKYAANYVSRYEELRRENGRIHTTYKVTGTVTGRLSSGKEDAEKITGRTKDRGVNLQQVPRDKLIRSIFGAEPGWAFVEADFSQIELRGIAFISRDPVMIHLFQTGQDLHLAMAMKMTGLPASQITPHQRKMAKPVNFGFGYGMGWYKFIRTSFQNYGIRFTEEEGRAFRKAYFELYPRLQAWHARQRRLVHANARVSTPMGRVRHLPDIRSLDEGVVAEAERQAINSPVQGFCSDMALLAMVILCQQFRAQSLEAYALGLVHDSINIEVWRPHLATVLPLIKDTMEHLPLKRKFGVNLDVPIRVDIKVGQHWGEGRELSDDEVYGWTKKLDEEVFGAKL